jgi:zinc-ribbon domain
MVMTFCEKCGAQLSPNVAFCGSCSAPAQLAAQADTPVTQPSQNRPTRAWYLVPIFLNIIGGIIGYFAVRKEDRQLANNLLILGIVMFVLAIIAQVLFFAAIMTAFMTP